MSILCCFIAYRQSFGDSCTCTIILLSFYFDKENMAFRKEVTVSKRYNKTMFDPSLAVDGDVSTDLLKCSLTASREKEAWLSVDLGEVKNIASISFLHGGCKHFLVLFLISYDLSPHSK